MAEFDAAEVEGVGEERRALCELEFTTELALDVALFHLRGGLELFTLRLGREAFLIGAVDGVVDIKEVFRHEEHVVGHEREERDLLVVRHREFRHDLNLFALFTGELVLHLKGADGVDIVAEEVDTIGVFATERIDVEDGAAQSKLSWFVDVVHLVEAELAEGFLDIRNGNRLVFGEDEGAGVEVFLGNDKFCDGLGVGHDVQAP